MPEFGQGEVVLAGSEGSEKPRIKSKTAPFANSAKDAAPEEQCKI
jgi:hypothetical protein